MTLKRATTIYPGVRYREHSTRKHGIKKDRYFSIYYRLDGRKIEECVGWASQGMTAQKASHILGALKEAKTLGNGPRTLREKRTLEKETRDAEDIQKAVDTKAAMTVGQMFDAYSPQAKANKNPRSYYREENLWRLWIKPVIGSIPLKIVSAVHLEEMKKKMADAGRAPRTITYALATVRQVFNYARNIGLYDAENPVKKVKKPAVDNRRLRFLSHKEADMLLTALRGKSADVHNMAFLSLCTGMRAGEIFSLTWGDVDIGHGYLTLRDTKSGKNRIAFMTTAVKAMFSSLNKGMHDDLVFPGEKGTLRKSISKTFERTVDDLDFNKDVTDPRQKVVFHTLRHTFASWLVQRGVDLYTVRTLMGHSSIALTERYSHLGEKNLMAAVMNFEQGMVESSR